MAKTIKKKRGRPKKVIEPQSANFGISLQLGGKIFSGSGETPLDALVHLPRPNKLMNKGILTMTSGAKKKELLLMPVKLKRVFYNSSSLRPVIAKQLFAELK